MDWIEQAIFTSAQTDRSAGYQVVGVSPGVCEADSRELAVWGPSHDALLEPGPEAASLNFHPLPSGAYCISRTTPAGREYSGRGTRMYTHCLLVPPHILAGFANNPFALAEAVTAKGIFGPCQETPGRLTPLELTGGIRAVDTQLLAELADRPGATWMATLVQAALDSVSMAVGGDLPVPRIIAGLVNCLPPACRTEFSFSTGLKFSSRRPFKIVALGGDPAEQRRVERLYNLAVLRLDHAPPDEFTPVDTWARLILRVLRAGRIAFLSGRLTQRQPLSLADLPALGMEFLEAFEASSADDDDAAPLDEPLPLRWSEPPEAVEPKAPRTAITQAHAAHRPIPATDAVFATTACRTPGPSTQIDSHDPEVLHLLEKLDDLVYEAIAGKDQAARELTRFWPVVQARLDPSLLAESREQYLRYVMTVWTQCTGPDGIRQPERAVRSLDVLWMLFGDHY